MMYLYQCGGNLLVPMEASGIGSPGTGRVFVSYLTWVLLIQQHTLFTAESSLQPYGFYYRMNVAWGFRCSSMVDCLPAMCEALGLFNKATSK